MFDSQFNGNDNRPVYIFNGPVYFIGNQQQQQFNKPEPKPEQKPEKEKKSLMDRLKPLLGFGGAVADFIKKILPIILLAFGIQS